MRDSWELALDALRPADAEIDAALSCGDTESAMRAAYSAACAAITAITGGETQPGTAHGVWVELTPTMLLALEDGTLMDQGTFVSLSYRNWTLGAGTADTS